MIATRLALIVATLIWSSTGIGSVTDPFGGETVRLQAGPLVQQWRVVSVQMLRDKALVESCLAGGSERCAPTLGLLGIVSEARQQNGLAMIGHINRAINLVITPAPGGWLSPLDALELGNGDCKSYSIAKYFALRELGISHVRIVIVHNEHRHENHMVVAVYFDGRWRGRPPLSETLREAVLPD